MHHMTGRRFNLADSQPYDLLMVDRMLPGLEGTEIVKKLRENRKKYANSISDGTGDRKINLGLDVGADDYYSSALQLTGCWRVCEPYAARD